MAFKLTSKAKDVVDYTIPMVNGEYVFDITKVEQVGVKDKPKKKQWRLTYQVVGMIDALGFLDTEQAGRTIGYNHFQLNDDGSVDLDNSYVRALFIAVGTKMEMEDVDTIFTFDDSVSSEADFPAYLTDKQIVCSVTSKPDTNKVMRNNAGFAKPITDEVNQMLLQLAN